MAINEITSIDVKTLPPFKRLIMTLGELPTSYLESMTYAELLMWFCNFLQEKVLPTINNNAEALQDIITYLKNLDLQDEVNNKLDEMAESGQLEEIVAQYLNANALWCFDTVADMKTATNLIDGSYAKTLGYHTKNDNGMATYKIRQITNDDVVDEMFILSLDDDNLIAELILSDKMNLSQFGIYQNNINDDSNALQDLFNKINDKNIELNGNYNPIKITKTIYIPSYVKLNNVYFKTNVSADNFTNGYMFGINTTNLSTWTIQYPTSTIGYIKHCKIENENENNIINGIYNYANNLFEDIHFIKLNTAFRTGANYLDTVRMKNFQISSKIGTDYALILGYLGDSCSLDTAHMYDTIGSKLFINIGNAHNPIYLSNIIANGKIVFNNSIVNINNIHAELTTDTNIEVENAQLNIENGYFYHVDASDKYNLYIKNYSSVTLKNILFMYFLNNYSYQNASDNDINITSNSTLTTINCFKALGNISYADRKFKNSIKTNLDTQTSIKQVKNYFSSAVSNKQYNNDSYYLDTVSASTYTTTSNAKWNLSSGTYYYKIIPMLDNTRLISTNYSSNGNVELTNNENGFTIASLTPGNWRVYRGTSNNNYNNYVDISNINNVFIDNGYIANGYKWTSRTAGDIDTINNGFVSIIYNENGTVTCTRSVDSAPTVGTWKRGDIIYNISTGGSPSKGYICVTAGTPGTWRNI